MASTAWTATRQELVEQLQTARAENELLRREYANRLLTRRQADAEYRARLKATKQGESGRVREAAQKILDTLPPDPQADWHRTTLAHELRKAHT